MDGEGRKKLIPVNGFKAPVDWYAKVKKVAEERGVTIGTAIQYVFDLGLPIYERVRLAERAAIEEAIRGSPQKGKGAADHG